MRIGKTDFKLTNLSEAEEVQAFTNSHYKRLSYRNGDKCSVYYKDMLGNVKKDEISSKMHTSTPKSRKFAYYLYTTLGIIMLIPPLTPLGLIFIGLGLIAKNY